MLQSGVRARVSMQQLHMSGPCATATPYLHGLVPGDAHETVSAVHKVCCQATICRLRIVCVHDCQQLQSVVDGVSGTSVCATWRWLEDGTVKVSIARGDTGNAGCQ